MASSSPSGEAYHAAAAQGPPAQTGPAQTFRATPQYPQTHQSLPVEGGLERTASRRRRTSGQDPQAGFDQPEMPPAAPEPPRSSRVAPPLSYRDPYMNTGVFPEQGPSSMSFAARAGIVPDTFDLQQSEGLPASPQFEKRGSRRGSIKQTPDDLKYSQRQAPTSTLNAAPKPNNEESRAERSNSTVKKQQRPPQIDTVQRSPNDSIPSRNRESFSSPAVRSASYKPSPTQPREWAADRSPLQKLEVKLNDISKEEKRARVELAEQRLREAQGLPGSRRASQSIGAPIRQVSISQRAVSGPATERRSMAGVTSGGTKSSPESGTTERRYSKEQQAVNTSAARQPLNAVPARSSSQRHSTKSRDSKDLSNRRQSADNGRNVDRGVRFHHEVEDMDAADSPRQESLDTQNAEPRTSLPKSTRQQVLTGRAGEPDHSESIKEQNVRREDPVPAHAVRSNQHGLKYEVPPQTAAGIETRKQVGFGSRSDDKTDVPAHHRPHLSAILHHGRHDKATPGALKPAAVRHLNEWQNGAVAHLKLSDLEPKIEKSQADRNKAWWEQSSTSNRRRGKAEDFEAEINSYDGYLDEQSAAPTTFNPPLWLKCGPMIRYTGMKRQKLEQPNNLELETWRGSVMIVTEDDKSTYDPPPSLRLFYQPMQLLPPPPRHFDDEEGDGLEAEYVDPIGGLPKISRSGGTIYVKPVEDLEEGKDVSRVENDDGLYEETRTANVPTSYGKADELLGLSPHSPHPRNRAAQKEGRQVGRYREVKGVRLHAERGVTFWRFNIEVELDNKQQRIAYRINRGASVGFWVPARGQTMNIMFHSCNGFSLSVDSNTFSGPDPLWRDVMNAHQIKPFHVMIGGGDQIYNDAIMEQTRLFQEWIEIRNPLHKHEAPFSPEMRDELESFYLDRYSMWFSQGLFGMANSQIPMINMWDDHDIIDGYGSYPHHTMRTPVFCGLGNVAFKYYMLFQHQSVVDETSADEPSWLLGASPGPYINELSRSVFIFLGKKVAFLALDCRTERMRDEILSEASYDLIFDRLHREVVKGETKHLIVLLGVPIAYPRLVWLENVLTSRALDPLKALGRIGMLGNLMNKFDGGVEILDDLDDHWTARNHKDERNWFVEELQEIAAEKSVRVTILGGDVHLAAVGQFYSNKRLMIPKDRDFRYMPNIISSAIVNTPPPDMMADIMNKRNKIHHLNAETDEDMIPMFTHDVDGKSRNNKRLLPKRNWCSITEYHPGSTPPPTPPSLSPSASEESLPQQQPGPVQRTLSLGRISKPANLIRRLSLGNKEPTSPQDHSPLNRPPADDSPLSSPNAYNRSHPAAPAPEPSRYDSAPIPARPINTFHRRPTNLSEKAAAKGGAIGEHVDLELGLDISLNCEIKQGDTSGSTEQYRLLVPALFYDGALPEHKRRKGSILKRLGSLKGNRTADKQNKEDWSDSESESHSEVETGSNVSEEPKKGGPLRRLSLSGVFSRPTNLLQKQRPAPLAPTTPQTFKPRPQLPPGAPPVASLSISSPRPQQNAQPARSSPVTAYQARQSSQSGSPSRTVQRGSNTHVPSPLQRTQPSSSPSPPPERVSHNQTAPLDYDSDELSEEMGIAKRSNSRHNRSGASKFFGEDLPPNGLAANGGAMNGGVAAGKQNRHSTGYSGIDAYQDEKKGWRKFF